MRIVRFAKAVGQDKGQISRALAGLASRKLVERRVNRKDNGEVLVSLTPTALTAHEAIVAGAQERTQRLLEQLDDDEVAPCCSPTSTGRLARQRRCWRLKKSWADIVEQARRRSQL